MGDCRTNWGHVPASESSLAALGDSGNLARIAPAANEDMEIAHVTDHEIGAHRLSGAAQVGRIRPDADERAAHPQRRCESDGERQPARVGDHDFSRFSDAHASRSATRGQWTPMGAGTTSPRPLSCSAAAAAAATCICTYTAAAAGMASTRPS